jgi:hypothetical protein
VDTLEPSFAPPFRIRNTSVGPAVVRNVVPEPAIPKLALCGWGAICFLGAQDYPRFKLQLVVVDDGSSDAEVPAALDLLESDYHFAARGWLLLREPNRYLGGARSVTRSLGDTKSSLGDAKSSLGDAKSSLGDAKSSLGDAKSSLGDATSSLGDAKSSLGDAESSLGDAESSRWVTLRACCGDV